MADQPANKDGGGRCGKTKIEVTRLIFVTTRVSEDFITVNLMRLFIGTSLAIKVPQFIHCNECIVFFSFLKNFSIFNENLSSLGQN